MELQLRQAAFVALAVEDGAGNAGRRHVFDVRLVPGGIQRVLHLVLSCAVALHSVLGAPVEPVELVGVDEDIDFNALCQERPEDHLRQAADGLAKRPREAEEANRDALRPPPLPLFALWRRRQLSEARLIDPLELLPGQAPIHARLAEGLARVDDVEGGLGPVRSIARSAVHRGEEIRALVVRALRCVCGQRQRGRQHAAGAKHLSILRATRAEQLRNLREENDGLADSAGNPFRKSRESHSPGARIA
eukprot:scaffold504_cov240-Pinguiococcus_pyrenoidosus.AAC.7